MNSDPVPDQYYNPVTAIARGDESAITVIASSHPEYFFYFLFFIGRRRQTRSRLCVDGMMGERDDETRCQRRKQGVGSERERERKRRVHPPSN